MDILAKRNHLHSLLLAAGCENRIGNGFGWVFDASSLISIPSISGHVASACVCTHVAPPNTLIHIGNTRRDWGRHQRCTGNYFVMIYFKNNKQKLFVLKNFETLLYKLLSE